MSLQSSAVLESLASINSRKMQININIFKGAISLPLSGAGTPYHIRLIAIIPGEDGPSAHTVATTKHRNKGKDFIINGERPN